MSHPPGETLFFNGRVWDWKTHAATNTWFIVLDGVFGQVGTGDPPHWDGKRIDLCGRLVLPGLHDSHIHSLSTREAQVSLDLKGCQSIEDLLDRLRKFVAANPARSCYLGSGWDQDLLGSLPSRTHLDSVVATKPVFLLRKCYHIGVANTKAIEEAKIPLQDQTFQIPSGAIDWDEESQSVTGIFREEASFFMSKRVEEKNTEVRKKYLEEITSALVGVGLTGVQSLDTHAWDLYSALSDENKIPLRVFLTPFYEEFLEGCLPASGTKHGMITMNRIKIFLDGSIGAKTAAVRAPYPGTCDHGILCLTPKEMTERCRNVKSAGHRLEVHVIGDRAAEVALDSLREAGVAPDERPVLVHCQVLGPDLLGRMVSQNAIASVQPSFVPTDSPGIKERIPEETIPYSYCWKTMIERGIVVAGSSDGPIESFSPLRGMYDAVFRDHGGPLDQHGQRLSFAEALSIYTRSPAYAVKLESSLGEISAGWLADFVVLDKDVSIDPRLLLEAQVDQTWVGGILRMERK